MSYSSHTIYLCSCSAVQPLEPGNTNPELKQHETVGIPLTHQTENPEHKLEPKTKHEQNLDASSYSQQTRSTPVAPTAPSDIRGAEPFYAYWNTVQADTMRQRLNPNLASSWTLNGVG